LRTVACSLMSPDAVSLIRTDKESIASPSRAWIVSSGSTVGWCSTAERTKTGDQSRPLRWPQMPGYPCQPAPCSGSRLVRAGRSRVLVAIGGTVTRAFASSSYWPRSRGPRPSAGPREGPAHGSQGPDCRQRLEDARCRRHCCPPRQHRPCDPSPSSQDSTRRGAVWRLAGWSWPGHTSAGS
jgi:hypothetical protein